MAGENSCNTRSAFPIISVTETTSLLKICEIIQLKAVNLFYSIEN